MDESEVEGTEEQLPLLPLHTENQEEKTIEEIEENKEKLRNLIGFFILGVCADFGVNWVMTAAFDILEFNKVKHKSGFYCHSNSAGLVLLAGVVPEVLVRWIFPWFMQAISYHMRFLAIIVTCVTGVFLLGFSPSNPVALVAIVMGAISSAMIEITCLSLTSHFKRKVVPLFAAGTAASGIISSLLYAGVTTAGMPPKSATFLLLLVPFLVSITFWLLLELPDAMQLSRKSCAISNNWRNSVQDESKNLSFKEKTKLVIPLLKNLIPLFLVYLAAYATNQSLFELLYYKERWLTQARQYRWFMFTYCVGELIGKSLLLFFRIKRLFIPTSLAFVIFVVLLLEVMYTYIPSFWLTLFIIIVEGVCSGSVFVNAIYNVTEDVSKKYREFSMGLVTVADTSGAALAAAIALPLHKGLCKFKTHKM